MARMYPKTFPNDANSTGERKVFEYFKNSAPNDWYILHSFRLPYHQTVVFGEADFVVIAPTLGIFVLEIKSGGVGFDGTDWVFINRNGEHSYKRRGPFQQARDAMFAVEKIIVNKLGSDYDRTHILYGYGVIFTDERNFPVNALTEDEPWRLCQKSESDNYCAFIRELASKFENELRQLKKHVPVSLSADYADNIAKSMRPEVDCITPLKSFIEQSEKDIIGLTEEQYDCLDDILINEHIVITGGAGTGKTLLAVEDAKRSSSEFKKIGVFCFNRNLADYIRKNIDNPEIIVESLHSYMAKLFGKRLEANEHETNLFTHILPQEAIKCAREKHIGFDKIIVDEFQDLCDDIYLQFFDAILIGGLLNGKFSFYGDFARQAIYSEIASLNRLEQYAFFAKKHLTVNCRNTKNIGNELINVTGYEDKKYRLKIAGEKVDYYSWNTIEEEGKFLKDILKELKRKGIVSSVITILSPRKRENSVIDFVDKERFIIGNQGENAEMYLALFSTVQAFKGLENEVVILTDIDSYSDARLMYIAFSRARSKLYVLESVAAKKQRQKMVIGR